MDLILGRQVATGLAPDFLSSRGLRRAVSASSRYTQLRHPLPRTDDENQRSACVLRLPPTIMGLQRPASSLRAEIECRTCDAM